MKYNIKQSSLLMLFALFLVTFCFIACDDQDNEEQEQVGQLTPEGSLSNFMAWHRTLCHMEFEK
ncbi:hypothetical protein NXY15_07820 [Bacteroides thetaiotaomicron]|nr:hypothetical protein NXY15_07820 [Bacteroides thetaiotaomicron]